MKPKIAHLSSVHPAGDARILLKECRTLAAAGYEVVFIVPHDDASDHGGVRIHPLPRPQGRADRMLRTTWRVFRAARRERAAVYHFHDPELIPTGILLTLLGHRVIYDVHEDVPRQIMDKEWIRPGLRRLLAGVIAGVEGLGGRLFAAVVAATPTIAARFPGRRTWVVRNYPILSELAPAAPTPQASRPPMVTYIGGISEVRGANELAAALALLPEERGVRLRLAGHFHSPAFEHALRRQPGWERIDYQGWLDRKQVAHLLASSRAGLVTLHPVGNIVESLPVKLFEYMAAGVPVIASDFPLWREIVEGAGCGLLVDPRSPQQIADAIDWILAHPEEADAMGRRGRQAVEAHYNWDSEAETLLHLYRELLERS